jgi:TrmH RNA methyltransferase
MPISKEQRKAEHKICGFHACMTLFHHRPGDIIRAYVTADTRKPFGPMLKFCAQNRLAYHIVEPAELNKIAESDHHEGVCVLAKSPKHPDFNTFLNSGANIALWLVGVENPHNVGAILRTAAHFGVEAVLVTPGGPEITSHTARPANWTLPASAIRIAEGGAEHVPVIVAPGTVAESARALKKSGFTVYATSGNPAARDLFATEIKRPCVIALGAEGPGLPENLIKSADATLRIPGTGKVDSLNVSVAAGILAGAAARARK